MATPFDPGGKLGRCVHRGIDVPAQDSLRLGKEVCHVAERQFSDDGQIDIAIVAQLAPRGGAVDKRDGDPVRDRAQRVAQDFCKTRGLGEQRSQLLEDRRLAIGSKIDLPPIPPSGHETGADEINQLALHGSGGKACLAGYLAKKELLIRMAKQPPEDQPPRPAEQHCTHIPYCSHYANNCT